MSPLFGRRSVRKRSSGAGSKERSGSAGNGVAPRKGLARLIPPPPGSSKSTAKSNSSKGGGAETPKTRSYSAEDILAANSTTATHEPASNGHGAPNGHAHPGGQAGAEARPTDRFEGMRYKKDGRIGRKDDEQNTADKEIFDAEGTLWSKIIFWTFTVLAVLGALFLSFVLLRAAMAFWPGGEEGSTTSTAVTAAPSTGAERPPAALATGFVEGYLTMNAGEDTSSIEERLAPFVANTELASLIAQSSAGETEREVRSVSAYRVQQVSEGRYAVFVDALTSSPDSGEEADAATGDEGPSVQRQAMKVYVGGSEGRYAVVAPPTAITPPSPGEDVEGALGAGDSYELTDEALEDHLRGYFSAAYGSSDAQASVEQFFSADAEMPAAPAEDYTYLDLEGATLYEVASEEVGEGYTEAYQVEAYVSVREESTGAISNQTHLLQVAKTEGGEWTITGSIGG